MNKKYFHWKFSEFFNYWTSGNWRSWRISGGIRILQKYPARNKKIKAMVSVYRTSVESLSSSSSVLVSLVWHWPSNTGGIVIDRIRRRNVTRWPKHRRLATWNPLSSPLNQRGHPAPSPTYNSVRDSKSRDFLPLGNRLRLYFQLIMRIRGEVDLVR